MVGRAVDELIFDSWTPLAFKRALGGRSATSAGVGWSAPSWVGDHARRLRAYTVLRAYQDNAAREFMTSTDRDEIDNRREYGDAALMVNSILGALLGDQQVIHVEGSELAEEEDSEDQAEGQRALALQEWLEDWATSERLGMKMIETERRAVGLGDGVYSLGWSNEKGRPRLRVWDPGFYFPVLSDGNEDDFPERVHIAWEIIDEDAGRAGKVKIRRLTWELGPIMPAADAEGLPLFDGDEIVPLEGDSMDPETGRLTRQYPWNDKPSTTTCYFTDATWTLDRGTPSVYDLTDQTAEYGWDEDGELNRRDIGVDFIPVVHVPNTVSLIEHYGRSSIATVLQVLDDIASADTDLASAAATTGSPVMTMSKATFAGKEAVSYRPGQIIQTGEGTMGILDTSRALDALLKYIEFLLKRLSINARLPEAVLGRVSPSDVPSGIALALSFGPLEQMVKEMRLVRDEKYPLLMRFAQRMAVAGGDPTCPQDFDLRGEVQFGSFLPQDLAEAVNLVTKLLAAKAISLETAIATLMEAGMPIREAAAEVERIQSRDFEAAELLLAATGDKELVYEYLGREMPEEEPRPEQPVVPVVAPGTQIDPTTGLPVQPGDEQP